MQRPPHSANEHAMPSLALLAGGLATRLGAIARQIPKSLVEAAGEPFIAHQLRMLASRGVNDVVICCGHFGGMIQDFVQDGSQFDCRVRYSCDGHAPLGTGGAIRKALPLLGDRFFVMYGDSYLTLNFRAALAAFEQSGQTALMTVFRNDDRWDASNVEFADRCILRYAKRSLSAGPGGMQHIDSGVSIFCPHAFQAWPEGVAFDLCVVQAELVARRQMAGFESAHRFYEIGSTAGLRETDAYLRSQSVLSGQSSIGVGA